MPKTTEAKLHTCMSTCRLYTSGYALGVQILIFANNEVYNWYDVNYDLYLLGRG